MSFSDLTIVKYFDRVRDFTRTSGTDAVVLEGEPPLGYRGFDEVLANGERCHYCIIDSNGAWAIYRGNYVSSTGSLTKVQLLSSSSGTDIDFSAERKEIFLVPGAVTYTEIIEEIERLGGLTATGLIPFAVTIGGTGATTAANALANLGAQAQDVTLDYLSAFNGAASQILYYINASTIGGADSTAFGRALLALADLTALAATTGFVTAPVAIAQGGTSATTAAGARTALGLAIGSDVQAWDVVLDGFAALTTASSIPYFSAASTVSSFSSVAFGRSLLAASDAAAHRVLVGTVIGTNVQAWDVVLDGFAALSTASHIPYFSAASTVSSFASANFGRSLVAASDAAAFQALVSLTPGTNVQAWDVVLDGLAALSTASHVPYFSAASTVSSFGTAAFGRGLVSASDSIQARSTLGVVIGTNVQAWDVVLDGFAALSTASHIPYFSAASTVSSFGSQAYGRGLLDVASEAAFKTLANLEAGVDFQAFSSELAGIVAAVVSTGFLARTAASTYAMRILTASGGVGVTNPAGVAGDPLLKLDFGSLTAATDLDTAADYIAYMDTSASAVKKGLGSLFGSGGGLAGADATAMEAASATTSAVVPGFAHRHPSNTKAWGQFTGGGTPTMNVNYNMTSLTDAGTGDFTWTIATDFSTANYAIALGSDQTNLTKGSNFYDTQAAGSFKTKNRDVNGGGAVDPTTGHSVICAGDQ